MTSALRHPVTAFVAVMIVLSLAGPWLGIPLSLITQIGIYTLYGAGVNLMLGYTGLVPFGASVFFGIASYAVALCMLNFFPLEPLSLMVAVALSLLIGTAIGALILHRRGLYFSLLTLAFSQLAFEIAYKWTSLTGGENGLQDVPRPWLTSPVAFHVFVICTVAAGLFFLWRIAHSPFGRVLQAIRDNEQRVRFLGYDTYRYKLLAFAISAGLVGYAGGLLALLLQGAYANNLGWQRAGDALLMTILGGIHHFLGPLLGSIVFLLLTDKLSAIIENWWLLFAPTIIIFVLIAPEGIYGLIQRCFGVERWTLTRDRIPARPLSFAPFLRSGGDEGNEPVLSVRALSKRFGSLVVASDIDLKVFPRRLHSIIGPNGAGKTTFFNLLSGYLQPNSGTIEFQGRQITKLATHKRVRAGLGRSFQIISVFKNLTAFETVRIAVQACHPGRAAIWTDAHDFKDMNAQTWSLLDAVRLTERAGETCKNLSHGELRLLEIAVTLATEAKLLLLDEPLAGLAEVDRQLVATIIRQLADSHAVLLIEHDIDRVLQISDRITVLHQGKVIADGAPAEVAANPVVVEAYLGKSRSEKVPTLPVAVARVSRSAAAVAPLLKLEDLRAGYDGSCVLDGLSMIVNPGEVVALLGRNGVGKTTTQRAIMGVIPAQSGRIYLDGQDITGKKPFQINRLGISIVPEGRRLFPNLTVRDNIRIAARRGGATADEIFDLFPKLRARYRARAENLSGGERQMLAIARALMAPSKLILLDEPFEGLAPAVVAEVMDAVLRLRTRSSMLIVEHKAELVLPIADHAYVLVNGKIAYGGAASELAADLPLQERLLGVAHAETTAEYGELISV